MPEFTVLAYVAVEFKVEAETPDEANAIALDADYAGHLRVHNQDAEWWPSDAIGHTITDGKGGEWDFY